MHIKMLIISQSKVHLHTRCSVHFHPIPFTRPSFSIFQGSGSKTNHYLRHNAVQFIIHDVLTPVKPTATWMVYVQSICIMTRYYYNLGTRPSKNRKGGSSTSAGVEVYTAPGMKAHFQLAFDYHSDVHLLEMLTAREPFSHFASFYNAVNTKRGR